MLTPPDEPDRPVSSNPVLPIPTPADKNHGHAIRAEGECVRDGDEDNRIMTGGGGEEWGSSAKDRQQTSFNQPEQSYEAAFNKVQYVEVRMVFLERSIV